MSDRNERSIGKRHEEIIWKLLAAANVTPVEPTVAVTSMESWLGLGDFCDETVEDSLPLDASVFQRTIELLCHAWDPMGSVSTGAPLMMTDNLMISSDLSPQDISLYAVWPSVQVTKWMIQWMELHLSETQEESILLIDQLFRNDPENSLVMSLFQHIQELPMVQSQFNSYTQSLRQGASKEFADPQSRLAQYQLAQGVAERLDKEWQGHLDRLQFVLGEFYRQASSKSRRLMRRLLGRVWYNYLRHGSSAAGMRQENTRAAGVGLTLNVLHRILLGSKASHKQLLLQHLLPLHEPDAMVLWRDQMSVIELYHKPLTQCCAVLLQKDTSLMNELMQPLLHTLLKKGGSTSKQVLLLHEIDTYLGLLTVNTETKRNEAESRVDSDGMDIARTDEGNVVNEMIREDDSKLRNGSPLSPPKWWNSLLTVLASFISSDHSRVAERALAFFKNKSFEGLVFQHFKVSLPILLRGIVSRPSWNPTVRKMTYHILLRLQQNDLDIFTKVSNEVFASQAVPVSKTDEDMLVAPAKGGALPPSSTPRTAVPTNTSLRAGMGSWRPPTTARSTMSTGLPGASLKQQPPSTVTGVAPWAVSSLPPSTASGHGKPKHPLTSKPGRGTAPWAMSRPLPPSSKPQANKQPPLTITGVAPWATKSNMPSSSSSSLPPGSHKRRAGEAKLPNGSTGSSLDSSVRKTGSDYVESYMRQLKPREEEEDGISSWSKIQLAETPTLLPNLKFHDLVFGHELGTGAFSVVKYARVIDQSKTRSFWPEYAVKIISTDKIRELAYEASVQREIAVLRVLSHPGIARLVSSFRFREGAYLVLEYASRGDLHSLLQKHGSIDHSSTRFVIGEVAAALASIHEAGLVYGDLKPENVVITEPGHIKLTDFGGCRPVTDASRERIGAIAKDLLKKLRDGDWKSNPAKSGMHEDACMDDIEDDTEEDMRIEGTTAYLPPEVVLGGIPNTTADSWALGCVMFQCLSGRPPILEMDDDATKQRIVCFDVQESASGNAVDELFADSHAASIDSDARAMITALLDRVASARPSMHDVARMNFFSSASVDIFSLHRQTAHPLDVGDVAPAPDAQWSRRQLSSIWSPQPAAYSVSLSQNTNGMKVRGISQASTEPIEEGDEAESSFIPFTSGSAVTPGLTRLVEAQKSSVSSN